MKLSKKEKQIARKERSFNDIYMHHNRNQLTTKAINLNHASYFVLKQYVHNCTIKYEQIEKTVMENWGVSKEDVLEYLMGDDIHKYSEDSDMTFRHIAYLSTFHKGNSKDFFKITLKLKDCDMVACLSEAVFLLITHPHLSQQSLERILTYRIGVPYEITHKSLSSSIEETFNPKVQDYLKKQGINTSDTTFDVCKYRATFLSDNSVHYLKF